MNIDIAHESWKQAAIAAGNLSELELTLGRVSAAIAVAERSVTFADQKECRDDFQRSNQRAKLANALHQAGRCDEAQRLVSEAEIIQAQQQPLYPRLHSGASFHYCELLLSGVERAPDPHCHCQRPLLHRESSGTDDQSGQIRSRQ